MAERADLEAAAAAGIIAPETVDPLADFLAARRTPAPKPAEIPVVTGEEDLRFIRNFHDVFLATGIALLAAGLGVAISMLAGRLPAPVQGLGAAALCLVCAGLLWLLAETFARRRRLFLPSIALCVSITAFCAVAGAILGATLLSLSAAFGDFELGASLFSRRDTVLSAPEPGSVQAIGGGVIALCAALAGLFAASGFYLRFRLPFSLALVGCAAAGVVFAAALMLAPDWAGRHLPIVLLPCGLALFAAGLWFDARDPARATRLSDNGFWLHVAAAPLILNGVLALAASNSLLVDKVAARAAGKPDTVLMDSAITLVVVFLLGLLSLLINRRALIVSALATTGVAIAMLMNATGLGEGALIAGVLVTLGGFVLVLGASWHGLRRALLGWLRPRGVWARIMPAESRE